MVLTQLCYVSRATAEVDRVELITITSESAAANAARDVTGSLLLCEGLFFQVLEGDEAVVMPLYEKISADPRHTDVQILSCQPVTERLFPDWAMSSFHEDSLSRADRGRLRAITARMMANRNGALRDEPTRELMAELRLAINREMPG